MTENKQPVFQQSETVNIQRSQINFAPYNPKNHSKDAIIQQKKNFKRVGFLGGIVWNKTTGNLVSGHKRIMSMDSLFKYDGTIETDYQVKVEQVEFDLKTEMEQNIYMDAASANTQQDFELLKIMLPEIDYELAGLDAFDLQVMGIDIPDTENHKIDFALDSDENKVKRKESIAFHRGRVKNEKDEDDRGADSYLVLNFSSPKNKIAFMARFDFEVDEKYIDGDLFSETIERID